MPFIGVRISWLMLARKAALGLVGRIGGIARRRQFEGPDPHLVFEPVAVVAQVILAQGEFGGDLLRFGGLCQVTATGEQRGGSGHEGDRGQEDEVGGPVLEIRGRDDTLYIADQEGDENQLGQYRQYQGPADAEQPARYDDEQRVIDQVGAAQTAVDRGNHGDTKPVAPDQHRAGREFAPHADQDQGEAACSAYPDVQQHARGQQGIVEAQQDGQRKADKT
jgi:hypothetical protein